MSRPSRAGALMVLLVGVAGLAWFALELTPPSLGYADTDSPAVSLRFLREHEAVYAQAGIALLVMAASLVAGTLAAHAALAARGDGLLLRTATVFGLVAAACFFLHGVLRLAVKPLLYIDSLDRAWGESTYLAMQLVGIHGVAQAGIVALCGWAAALSLLGLRRRLLPFALVVLGIFPLFRLLSILGPLTGSEEASELVWVAFMLSIPGTLAWVVGLGMVLLWRSRSVDTRGEAVPSPAIGAA